MIANISLLTWSLVALGSLLAFAAGFFLGRNQPPSGDGEHHGMMRLLSELGAWTEQYSGDLSQQKTLLDALQRALPDDSSKTLSREEVVAALKRIIDSNKQLHAHLLDAGRELEEKSQQIKSYLTEARTDFLTNLANRREFDRCVEAMFASFRRGGSPFIVALVDIDRFKHVNDTFGHSDGDRVLKAVAELLDNELADASLVARIGGDEFAILLCGQLVAAAQTLDRVRQRISKSDFLSGEQTVTISVGASQPIDDMGAASVVRRADEALYMAKNLGRNRVYYHDGNAPSLFDSPQLKANTAGR